MASLYFVQVSLVFTLPVLGGIVDHLTNCRVNATHRVKALNRGGWSIDKIKEQRVYWWGNSKPDHFDDDLRRELIGF